MTECWNAIPKQRPSFSDLVEVLTPEGYGEGGLSQPSTPRGVRFVNSSPTSEAAHVPPHIAAMNPVVS